MTLSDKRGLDTPGKIFANVLQRETKLWLCFLSAYIVLIFEVASGEKDEVSRE